MKFYPIYIYIYIYILIGLTLISGLILSHSKTANASISTANASIHVSEACTMSVGNPINDYVGVSNNTFTENVSLTKFNIKCNDASGFAIYAIGYSNDTYGTTDMIGNSTGLVIPTGTDAMNGDNTSHWSMIITKDINSYLPTNLTIENNFNNYHVIPNNFTKIASYSSSTDGINGAGVSIDTSYAVRISATQAADTYVGKVKYVLVHPNKVDNSNKPPVPLSDDDCPPLSICYAYNYYDVEGSMVSTNGDYPLIAMDGDNKIGIQQKTHVNGLDFADITTNSVVELIAPNYSKSGYGFAGWSTDFETNNNSIIYGPNETISTNPNDAYGVDISSKGLILYPVWVAPKGNIRSWDGCGSLTVMPTDGTKATLASITALRDERDNNVYVVAKLADNKCWMTENLRLDNTAIITPANTQSDEGAFGGIFKGLPETNNNNWSTNTSNSLYEGLTPHTLPNLNTNNTNRSLDASYDGSGNSEYYQWYGYGNYYSWPAAIADTTPHEINNEHVANTSICPIGWHLPEGGDDNNAVNNEFLALTIAMTGIEPNYTYPALQNTTAYANRDGGTQGTSASRMLRAFPSNFVHSGYYHTTSIDQRTMQGHYQTSNSTNEENRSYILTIGSNAVIPGNYPGFKANGIPVRCVADL